VAQPVAERVQRSRRDSYDDGFSDKSLIVKESNSS